LEFPPDLILTDLMMPFVGGRALLISLREHPQTAHVPVLLMSAAGQRQDADGFDAFIAKPLTSWPSSPSCAVTSHRSVTILPVPLVAAVLPPRGIMTSSNLSQSAQPAHVYRR